MIRVTVPIVDMIPKKEMLERMFRGMKIAGVTAKKLSILKNLMNEKETKHSKSHQRGLSARHHYLKDPR